MPLKIENIKFDKEEYIFWEDKEMKISFELVSDDKEYKLNSVNVNYWGIVYIDWEENEKILSSVILLDNFEMLSNDIKKFDYLIPIKYPNINKTKVSDIDIENDDEYDNLAEIKNYIWINVDIKLNPFDCNEKIFPSIKYEWKNYKYIKEENNIKNDDSNINIWFFEEEFVSKDLYNYLLINNKYFKYIDFLRRFLKNKLYVLLFIILFIGIIYFIKWYFSNFINNFWWLIIFFSIITVVYFFLAIGTIIIWIKTSIIDIEFNNEKMLKDKIENNNIQISDIFKKFIINYKWKYSCRFNLYIECFLHVIKWEWKKEKNYYTKINSYDIWSYKWENISLNNIISKCDEFNSIFKISPSKLLGEKIILNYKIKYNFYSDEIFDDNYEWLIIDNEWLNEY